MKGTALSYSGLSIESLFNYHPPYGDQAARYERLRAGAKALAFLIEECCPSSAERTLAIRALHLASMHANSAIACNEAPEVAE